MAAIGPGDAWLDDGVRRLPYAEVIRQWWFDARPEALAGKRVLLVTEEPMNAALALAELDGLASRIVLCPPDLDPAHWPQVIADAEIDAVVHDGALAQEPDLPQILVGQSRPINDPEPAFGVETEWALFTSGTSGPPKMAVHTLQTLTSAIASSAAGEILWATFYDIRRYGGLQMLLRALLGGHAMVLARPHEPAADFLARVGQARATHVSGTPTHWRNAVMHASLAALTPAYVRLSGEIADQAILDRLRSIFPGARMGHAFASTEAGVAFEVADGREGFPRDFLSRPGPVQLRLEAGSLRIRSPGAARRYLGAAAAPVADDKGFVDTGDLVEEREGRCYFMGRANGVINVGGLKVHPEEVEGVINRCPGVRLSLVRARRNPIMGAVVVAEVAPIDPTADPTALREAVLKACRAGLAPFKVPASVKVVEALRTTGSGKIERRDA